MYVDRNGPTKSTSLFVISSSQCVVLVIRPLFLKKKKPLQNRHVYTGYRPIWTLCVPSSRLDLISDWSTNHFMQNKAPPHFHLQVRDALNARFPTVGLVDQSPFLGLQEVLTDQGCIKTLAMQKGFRILLNFERKFLPQTQL